MSKRGGKGSKPLPELGAGTAEEIFISVGVALSWWEGSEDELMGLFKALCNDFEPIAVESYVQAPRNVRSSMLKLALKSYAHRFLEGEVAAVLDALKRLDALAEIRNQIAHGHCSNFSAQENGVQVASGHYLLPSLNEGTYHERNHGFHHIPATINAFTAEVRLHRGRIMDVSIALRMRNQDNLDGFGQMLNHHVKRIARSEVSGPAALAELEKFLEWTKRFGL